MLVVLVPHASDDGSAIAATQARKFAFCKQQRAVCYRFCNEKRGDDASCIGDCDGRMSPCVNSGCFHWRDISAVAKWGAKRCVK